MSFFCCALVWFSLLSIVVVLKEIIMPSLVYPSVNRTHAINRSETFVHSTETTFIWVSLPKLT